MHTFVLLVAVIVVSLLGPWILILAQAPAPALSRIDPKKPTVFLRFDSRVKGKEDCSLKEVEAFRLRLQNNSSAPINVAAGYAADRPLIDVKGNNGRVYKGLPAGTVTRMCYQPQPMYPSTLGGRKALVGPTRGSVPEISQYCTCEWEVSSDRQIGYQGIWIPPGGHILFDVPVHYLGPGLRVYTVFRYEWEMQNFDLTFEEPQHQIFMYSSDIPRKVD